MKMALVVIFLAGLNSTIGNILLKISRDKIPPDSNVLSGYLSTWFLGALVFYGINVFFFAKALDYLPVNIGYPILAASSFILLGIASWMIFGNRLSAIQLSGLFVIVIGILMLSQKKII